jgi:2-polyprenyl-3-methyl-5-hydroxy-6-metoxy-1,4-benzoquinol methylase
VFGIAGQSIKKSIKTLHCLKYALMLVSLRPMQDTILYTLCPVCSNSNITKALTAKDFTVTGELFDVFECNQCTARFTQQVPVSNAIGKYYQSTAYISHTETNEGLVNRIYLVVRNYTLHKKTKLIASVCGVQKGNLLDVGAGAGAFAAAAKNKGWNVTGLEPDETARATAQKNNNIELQPTDNLFALQEQSYDVITLWHVLEHVHALHDYISAFKKLLKPNGRLIIAVPNYTSFDAQHYKTFWAAYDVPRHLYHFSPESIAQLIQQHGFVVEKHKPMWFDSFYVSMLSEQYKSGKNNFISAVFNGLRSNLKAMNDVKKCSSVIYVIRNK